MGFEVKNKCVIISGYKAIPIEEISSVSVDCKLWLSIQTPDMRYSGYFKRDGMGDFYSTDKDNKQSRIWSSDLDRILGDFYHTDQEVSFNVYINFYFKHTDKHIELPHRLEKRSVHLDEVREFKEELVTIVKKVETDLIEDITSMIYGEDITDTLTLKE